MSNALVWDQIGEKLYETGVSKGVLYPIDSEAKYSKGYAWNGLTAVNENPSGAEETKLYADNSKYGSLYSAEDFGATIEAYMSPKEFDECDGTATLTTGVTISQQDRKTFGFSYQTLIGNDTQGTDYGYKIHLVYGAKAKPSQKNRSTVNESPEAGTLSWEVTTTPVPVTGFKPTAHIVIDSTTVTATKLAAIEKILYGSADADARLPLPDEVKTIIDGATTPSGDAG